MWPPIRTARSELAAERPPVVAGLVALALEREPVEKPVEPGAGGVPGVGPGDPLGAVLVARELLQLAQLGDDATGVEGHGATLDDLGVARSGPRGHVPRDAARASAKGVSRRETPCGRTAVSICGRNVRSEREVSSPAARSAGVRPGHVSNEPSRSVVLDRKQTPDCGTEYAWRSPSSSASPSSCAVLVGVCAFYTGYRAALHRDGLDEAVRRRRHHDAVAVVDRLGPFPAGAGRRPAAHLPPLRRGPVHREGGGRRLRRSAASSASRSGRRSPASGCCSAA